MSKCIKCGRTAEEIFKQDGSIIVESDMPFVCERCKQMEEVNQQNELLRKSIMFDNQKNQITRLKQQLAEKDKEIKKLNWQLKDKDFIIKNLNHSLSVAPNANAGQRARIDELTKIVKEKDEEIERLKNLFELNNEVVINQGKEIFDLRVQVLQQKQNQTQLALQELEKVKILLQNAVNYEGYTFVEIYDAVNNQIKELKGEKDVED